ncbi:MAG: alpha/beta fold hydrolase, partial [bacterium]
TQFAASKDGMRIAYDITGTGPALVLIHGAGKTRKDWHKTGYVKLLAEDFTVITLDARGSGESDPAFEVSDFSIGKICDDVLTTVDACRADRFAVWGYSFGGNVARYLGAWSDRPTSIAMIGVSFGPAVTPEFDRYIDEFIAKYGSVAQRAKADARKDAKRASAVKGSLAAWVACFQAMRAWPTVEPSDVRCPAMVLAGTENHGAAHWIEANRDALHRAGVRVQIVPDLDHPAEFTHLERVYSPVRDFLIQATRQP